MSDEQIFEELDIGEEQVSSNECWDDDEAGEIDSPVYGDDDLGDEQVASNDCYNDDEEE